MRPYERLRLDPLEARRREVLDFLGLSRNSPLTLPELIVGPTRPDSTQTQTNPAPAEPVQMVVVDGVRYRPEDAPDAPRRRPAPPGTEDDDPLMLAGG